MPEAQCYTARRLVRKRSLSPPFSAAGQSADNAMEQIVTHPFGTLVGRAFVPYATDRKGEMT
ncbi:hypothetical protein F7234_07040 [Pseudomonas putida]|uniref:hypothetical protein n=1 Tax=Pseudomonas putida TaxID=303 RepID=UPI00125EB6A3|nr:hypothetical protein [Pseudomonas putida]KAB5625537.1 hypothetical protein F7234_07040 [Pseudomonas putida]